MKTTSRSDYRNSSVCGCLAKRSLLVDSVVNGLIQTNVGQVPFGPGYGMNNFGAGGGGLVQESSRFGMASPQVMGHQNGGMGVYGPMDHKLPQSGGTMPMSGFQTYMVPAPIPQKGKVDKMDSTALAQKAADDALRDKAVRKLDNMRRKMETMQPQTISVIDGVIRDILSAADHEKRGRKLATMTRSLANMIASVMHLVGKVEELDVSRSAADMIRKHWRETMSNQLSVRAVDIVGGLLGNSHSGFFNDLRTAMDNENRIDVAMPNAASHIKADETAPVLETKDVMDNMFKIFTENLPKIDSLLGAVVAPALTALPGSVDGQATQKLSACYKRDSIQSPQIYALLNGSAVSQNTFSDSMGQFGGLLSVVKTRVEDIKVAAEKAAEEYNACSQMLNAISNVILNKSQVSRSDKAGVTEFVVQGFMLSLREHFNSNSSFYDIGILAKGFGSRYSDMKNPDDSPAAYRYTYLLGNEQKAVLKARGFADTEIDNITNAVYKSGKPSTLSIENLGKQVIKGNKGETVCFNFSKNKYEKQTFENLQYVSSETPFSFNEDAGATLAD